MGYPESRRRLVSAIQAKQISNAVIATGDVHQNIVGYLPANDQEPDRNQVATEFVCTSISSLGDGRDIKVRGADFRKIIAGNPNVLFANGQRGYQVFSISPTEWRTDIMKVDKVSDQTGKLSRLAGFTMERGSPLAIPS
jgi:alkaline phosphatase D